MSWSYRRNLLDVLSMKYAELSVWVEYIVIDGKHLPHLRDIFTDDDAELIIRLCRDTLQYGGRLVTLRFQSFDGHNRVVLSRRYDFSSDQYARPLIPRDWPWLILGRKLDRDGIWRIVWGIGSFRGALSLVQVRVPSSVSIKYWFWWCRLSPLTFPESCSLFPTVSTHGQYFPPPPYVFYHYFLLYEAIQCLHYNFEVRLSKYLLDLIRKIDQ